MEEQLVSYLEHLAQTMPLTWFSFFGSILTEVIALIPSPIVAIIAGTFTYEQQLGVMFIFVLATAGSLGKTLSTLVTYWIADKFEDFLTHSSFAKVLGVDENEVEKYGQYLSGTNHDNIAMLVLRSMPFMPTLPISLLAGMIKLDFWTYTWTTFVGIYLRFLFFAFIAYEGIRKYSGLLAILDSTYSIVQFTLILGVAGWVVLFLRKRWRRIIEFFIHKKPAEELTEVASKPSKFETDSSQTETEE